ncbi:hypothetical protein DLR61_18865 [Vibrio tarriae]|nr:hypothetical protein DLR61_18865 [Vibrio tarriae]
MCIFRPCLTFYQTTNGKYQC